MITRPNTKQFVQQCIQNWQNNDLLNKLAKTDSDNHLMIPIVAINDGSQTNYAFGRYANLLLSTFLLRLRALNGDKAKFFWADCELNNQINTSKSLFETGLIHENTNLLNVNDYEYLKFVWSNIGQLYTNNLIQDEDQIQAYDPSTQTWLSNQQIKYESQNSLVAIIKFKISSQSKNRLLSRVIDQINQEISTQNTLLKEIQIKISKNKHTSVFNSLFSSIPDIDSKSKANLEPDAVEKKYQDQLLVIKSNIETLKDLKAKLDPDNSMYILSWINQPWLVPANTALLVNAEAEYTLFYSKLKKELYLIAETQATKILKLSVDPELLNISQELETELNGLTDSGDYFEKLDLGISKLVTFLGSDLQGLEYEPIFEPDQPINDSNYLNANKIYTQNDIKASIGTGIYSLTPAFNAFDYIIATKYNLPIRSHLDNNGKINTDNFSSLEALNKVNFLEASNLIIGTLDRNGQLFATFEHEFKIPLKIGEQNRVYFGINKAKYIKPDFWERSLEDIESKINQDQLQKFRLSSLIDRKYRLIDTSQTGLPLPIWQPLNKLLPNIAIGSFEQVLKYAANPIHKLINYRELNQSLYLEEKIVIATDKFAKLPLGLNAIQFRSIALSELNRNKFSDANSANKIFQELFVEIQELFTKYKHVQVILEPREQALLTEWLLELPSGSNQIINTFHFYQPIDLTSDNKIQLQNHIRLLDWSKTSLSELVIEDEIGNKYIALRENLLPSLGHSGLVSYIANQVYADNSNQVDVIISQENLANLISSLAVFGLDKRLNLYTTGKINSQEHKNYQDILPIITEFGPDAISIYFAQSGVFEGEELNFDLRSLAKITKQTDGLVDQFLFWYQLCLDKQPLPTLILSSKYKKLINRWWHAYTTKSCYNLQTLIQNNNWTQASNTIIDYLETLNSWYLPRAKKLYPINPQEVTVCVADTLQVFIYLAQVIMPFNSEKIHTTINQNRIKFSPLIFSKEPKIVAVSTVQQEILERMLDLNQLISEIQNIRIAHKIRLRQPLYMDLSLCVLDQEYIDIIINDCNLLSKNLINVEGEIIQLEGYYGALTIDLVIDETLANLGFGRDFERSVQDFRKQQGYKHNEVVGLIWQLDESDQWELVQKVIKNISWHKLNLEISWVEGKETNSAKKLEIKDLCTIWVWERT